jgi:ferredoxin
MGFMDALNSAFANDDTLGEQQAAGLKKRKKTKTVTWRGPKPANPFEQQKITTSEVISGQRLMDVARDAGIPVRYSCMNGSCGICNVKVDGQTVPMCMTKAPDADVTIDYTVKGAAKVPKGVVVSQEDQARSAGQKRLEDQLRAEMEAKKANSGGGGFPWR